MQEFVVLGQVPGTDTQLSFTAWMLLSAMIISLLCIALARHRITSLWNVYLIRVRTKKITHLLTVHHLL